ncbi:MAG: Zn-ribbon domain-containing OB-fold protein [Thermodesulfobacteriota bacterium]
MAKKEVDDRFKKFGTVSFTAISKTNDFISYLEEGKVMGTRCKECGAVYFPPRSDCSKCLNSTMEWFEVTGTGTLLTFSELKYGPVGFEDDLPYTIALLNYGDYKVFGRISSEIPYEELSVGMELKTTFNTLPNGQLNYVFTRP